MNLCIGSKFVWASVYTPLRGNFFAIRRVKHVVAHCKYHEQSHKNRQLYTLTSGTKYNSPGIPIR